jgi:hypothetical protein
LRLLNLAAVYAYPTPQHDCSRALDQLVVAWNMAM